MSRLERLVVLLETGSTRFIRDTAADQLSDLAKQHPEEILNLLSRVYPFLQNKKWETRVSSARAFGGIVSHAPTWNPNEDDDKMDIDYDDKVKQESHDDDEYASIKKEEDDELEMEKLLEQYYDGLISFHDWSLAEVLNCGKVFLASSGTEFNPSNNNNPNNNDPTDETNSDHKRLKTAFTEKLGLDRQPPIKEEPSPVKQETTLIKKEEPDGPSPSSQQSARMRAMAKRKAKFARSNNSRNYSPVDLSQSSVSRQLTQDGTIKDETGSESSSNGKNTPNIDITSQSDGKLVVEQKVPQISPILQEHAKYANFVWQFQGVFELLTKDLFNDVWEVRHGAAMGLRELVKYQATGAGRVKGKSKEENDRRNMRTLEDLCVRLITLFALDRFGDYVSDTVVAPVRENACQAFGALLLHLPEDTVIEAFYALTSLIKQDLNILGIKSPCWEAKHGGMLGLRYFVSIRDDLFTTHPELLDATIEMVLYSLNENSDDDVESVAASTLIPITDKLVNLKLDLALQIVKVIWNGLTDLKDDLSASIGSVMDLLAKLCSHKEVLERVKEYARQDNSYSFKNLIPRLYPFLRHSITSVRKSVLRTLQAFLNIQDDTVKNWIDGKACRLIFQNLLVEQNSEVLQLSMDVYQSLINEISKGTFGLMDTIFKEHVTPLLALLMTPIGVARFNYSMNTNYILRPSGHTLTSQDIPITGLSVDETNKSKKRKSLDPITYNNNINNKSNNNIGIPDSEYDMKVNIDAPVINGDVTLVDYEVLIKTRLTAASAMGKTLAIYSDSSSLLHVLNKLFKFLKDQYSTPRLFASIVLDEYIKEIRRLNKPVSQDVIDLFMPTLTNSLATPDSNPSFREFVPTLKGLRTQCLQLFQVFREQGKVSPSKIPTLAVLVRGEKEAGPDAFGIETAEKVVNEYYEKLLKGMPPIYKMTSLQALQDAKHRINMGISEAKSTATSRSTGILSSFASCSVDLNGLPKKLNPVIRALMDSIKNEESPALQKRTAEGVAELILQLNKNGKSGAANKVIKNLCGFLCVDTSEVPEFVPNKGFSDLVLSLRKEDTISDQVELAAAAREVYLAKIKRRGAKMGLEKLVGEYKGDLFERIPKIKSLMFDSLTVFNNNGDTDSIDDVQGQAAIDSLELIRSLFKSLDQSLRGEILDKLNVLVTGLISKYSVFRYSSSKCFATVCSTVPTVGFQVLVKEILPMLGNALDLRQRQGAIECVFHLCNVMGSDILPYVVFLIVPVLGRMSDANNDVRVLATTTFASIIKLVPLEAGIPDPVDMPAELLEGRDRERDFIQQMMDPSKIKPFELPVTIKATLRKYQQEGVNWLYFLNKYHLHGILCDDMGLGKTLQTICIVSSDHHLRAEEFSKTGAIESRKLPSIVICPPSLTGHWEQEFDQYASFLKVLVYAGSPSIRSGLRSKLTQVDVVITSYDVVRNDLQYISSVDYNYCVLDEGHIIKNASTKLTKAVKQVNAEHRLILSGTPIQNNVLELWSLFDFLMPGFLGNEKQFYDKFAKPIALSRTNKGDKEQEAGALALESLHKQVLPFMLRRLKEDVLSDLPPKIIQDYYCELSHLQRQLYKDFIRKQKSPIEADLKSNEKQGKQHIFQVLQYMRKLCNHPSLVLTPDHPQYQEAMSMLHASKMDINDIQHSPKLMSLKNLLLECGIGVTSSSNVNENVIAQHRALIFCQMKDMLNIVENDLLKKHMPSVSYMRLDGSTEPRFRQEVVRKFNNDPSIDVLLLTTKVGGLGLNLTGADTVIFVEHDWNPMNDLQAMDRAHRLGQKKVVNVYRLITKNTLEEKIMGLQKFKMNIASVIINQQNSGLASMDTEQLLDLFDDEGKITEIERNDNGIGGENSNDKKTNGDKLNELGEVVPNDTGLTGKAGSAVNDLAELWDESQYEEEYNLDTFIKTLR